VIGFALPRTFGKMVCSHKQGYAIVSVMAVIWAGSLAFATFFETHHQGVNLAVGHAAMEGKEMRFGVPASALFMTSTTLTSTGAVNSMHDSYTPFGGGAAMFNMMLGEIAPGGTGSGLYGMLVLAIVTVFVAGLMVGRTPEYLGKKIQAREVKLVVIYTLVMPAAVLVGAGIAIVTPTVLNTSIWNPGPHGFTEVLYAFTSAANNNGSAFAGITANTQWMNTALGLAMLVGRFFLIIPTLAIAGSLAKKDKVPASAGTFPTNTPLFAALLFGVVLIVAGLTFFPSLALGPIVEQLGIK